MESDFPVRCANDAGCQTVVENSSWFICKQSGWNDLDLNLNGTVCCILGGVTTDIAVITQGLNDSQYHLKLSYRSVYCRYYGLHTVRMHLICSTIITLAYMYIWFWWGRNFLYLPTDLTSAPSHTSRHDYSFTCILLHAFLSQAYMWCLQCACVRAPAVSKLWKLAFNPSQEESCKSLSDPFTSLIPQWSY